MKLNRRFSPLTLLLLSINGMVGSAWLFAPFYAAKMAGSGAIIAWLIAGGATALIAFTFAELSVLLPVAGGTAQIPQLSHGTFTSFMFSWVAWLSALTMAPIEVQAVLQYASTYFTGLTHMVNEVPMLTTTGLVWATILMLFLCIFNIASFKGLVRFNFVLFVFKVAVILLVIGWLMKESFHPGNFAIPVDPNDGLGTWKAILSAVAASGVAFAFTGFKHGVELAGEAKSKLAIFVAIVGSVLVCLLLYLGLQVAFIGALDPANLTSGWGHLTFMGDVGPFAGLAAALGLLVLLKFLYIDAVVSPLGAGLIYVTSTARIFYAMSKIGFFPAVFTKLNKQAFPWAAIMLNFVLGMFLFLPLPSWQSMVSFLVSGMVISYAAGPIALLCFRLSLKNEHRAFRLPAARFLCLIAFYCCNLMSYWTGWETIYKLAIAMVIGLGFFVWAYIRGRLEKEHLAMKSAVWVIPYFAGLILISYLGAFGGKNVIPFGWDFLVMFVFSAVILYLSVKYRSKAIATEYAAMEPVVW
ncbi:MAG: APC family permease [Gammaproteobacteria bacterium]